MSNPPDKKKIVHRLPIALATMIVQLGPPVLATGGWRRFARHPARRALVVAATGAAAAAAANGVNATSGTRSVERQRIAVPLIGVSILLGRLVAPLAERRSTSDTRAGDAVRWLGVLLYAAGTALFEWPRHVMGRHYSVQAAIQQDHELVTRGPYRLIRNPGYAGLLVFQAGYALVFRSLPGLVTLIPLAGVIRWRVADEERLLESEFGDDYRAYCARTPRFVPFSR